MLRKTSIFCDRWTQPLRKAAQRLGPVDGVQTDYNTLKISQLVFCQEIYEVVVNDVLSIDIGHNAAIS